MTKFYHFPFVIFRSCWKHTKVKIKTLKLKIAELCLGMLRLRYIFTDVIFQQSNNFRIAHVFTKFQNVTKRYGLRKK